MAETQRGGLIQRTQVALASILDQIVLSQVGN